MNLTRLQMPSANAGCDPLLLSEHAADYLVIGTVLAVYSSLIAIKSNRINHDEDRRYHYHFGKRLWSLSICAVGTQGFDVGRGAY